jgi:hypothetical protein
MLQCNSAAVYSKFLLYMNSTLFYTAVNVPMLLGYTAWLAEFLIYLNPEVNCN